MRYEFQCEECEHVQDAIFHNTEYDKKVTEDNRLKRTKCDECGAMKLYRFYGNAPGVMGGPHGYVSMERWQQQNPDHAKRMEEKLEKKLSERHRKRVMDNIDKQAAKSDYKNIKKPKKRL